jgi:hypothetical protein
MIKNPIPLGENRGSEGKKVKSYGRGLKVRFRPIKPAGGNKDNGAEGKK